MPSAPWAMNARAISTASCSVLPSGTQSVAEVRTLTGLPEGQTARHASSTSSGNRARPDNDPPYSSSRRFDTGDRKLESRYPWAMWTSSKSKPAWRAPRDADTNWSRTTSISARVIARGTWLRGP